MRDACVADILGSVIVMCLRCFLETDDEINLEWNIENPSKEDAALHLAHSIFQEFL